MLEPEVFRKPMYCTEESTCDIVGYFSVPPAVIRSPNSDSAPGELRPLLPPPRSAPAYITKHKIDIKIRQKYRYKQNSNL